MKQHLRKYAPIALAVLLVILLIVSCHIQVPSQEPQETQPETSETTPETTAPVISWPTYPATRQLTARQAFVYDCESESFTYLSGSENDRVYAASITKLFTAYVALQYLEPDRLITAGDVLDLVGAGSSVANIRKGDALSAEMLVEAMLLPSGNDAAYILAAETGWELENDRSISPSAAVSAFVAEMNRQAQALGMTGTQFVNPDGYHTDQHYTTHADLVTIAKVSLENETIMQYTTVGREEAVFENGAVRQWKNTNALIDPSSPYYCPYALGLKTGQTPSAGSCLLSAFDVGGRVCIIGVFGCPKVEDRFEDTLQLLNQFLENDAP